jgi:hypothetical protein
MLRCFVTTLHRPLARLHADQSHVICPCVLEAAHAPPYHYNSTTQRLNDAYFALVSFHCGCVCQGFDRRRGTNPFIRVPFAKMAGEYMMGRLPKCLGNTSRSQLRSPSSIALAAWQGKKTRGWESDAKINRRKLPEALPKRPADLLPRSRHGCISMHPNESFQIWSILRVDPFQTTHDPVGRMHTHLQTH